MTPVGPTNTAATPSSAGASTPSAPTSSAAWASSPRCKVGFPPHTPCAGRHGGEGVGREPLPCQKEAKLQWGAAHLSCTCHRWVRTQRSALSATRFCPKVGDLRLFAFRKHYNVQKNHKQPWKQFLQNLDALPDSSDTFTGYQKAFQGQ